MKAVLASRRSIRKIREIGVLELLLGVALRRRFTRAGMLVVRVGLPLPKVVNRGGSITVERLGLFPGVRLECGPGATLVIGNGTYLNRNTEIVAAAHVRIGRDCMIARDVLIMDTDQHPLPGRGNVDKPVEIGDRVWLGARSIILKGVTIGDDCIIGAGAVVTKSVPARSIAVGVPARVIGEIDGTRHTR